MRVIDVESYTTKAFFNDKEELIEKSYKYLNTLSYFNLDNQIKQNKKYKLDSYLKKKGNNYELSDQFKEFKLIVLRNNP